jgi:hypothetical protein
MDNRFKCPGHTPDRPWALERVENSADFQY